MKCYNCGRKKINLNEGRIADRSWPTDSSLPRKALGKWFCCYNCYQETLEARKRKYLNK